MDIMLSKIGLVFTELIGFVGEFITALVSEGGAMTDLLPVFVIGIAVSILLLCIKAVKSITWGA